MARTRKALPVSDNDGEVFERLVALFRARFPDEWAALALCPLQHGVVDIAERLKRA